MDKEPITPKGLERLRTEVARLKKVERPQVIQAIAEARAHGDLRENAEYHAAREKQGLLEARIRDLEHLLAHATVIDPKKHASDKVTFGASITLLNTQTEEKKTYQIVGKFESDIKNGKIPLSAPIARALIGKQEGDIVTIQVPKGRQEFEILKVEY